MSVVVLILFFPKLRELIIYIAGTLFLETIPRLRLFDGLPYKNRTLPTTNQYRAKIITYLVVT